MASGWYSVVGFIKMCRAGIVLSAGRHLAVKRRAPGALPLTDQAVHSWSEPLPYGLTDSDPYETRQAKTPRAAATPIGPLQSLELREVLLGPARQGQL